MKTLIFSIGIFALFLQTAKAQTVKLSESQELSVNLFRNPSIGLEYRYHNFSGHLGYYPTIFSSNGKANNYSNSFIRAGASVWYLPFGKQRVPSAMYSSVSYLRGLDFNFKNRNAALVETGVKLVIIDGLQFRIGAAVFMSEGARIQLNPTPGISYSIPVRTRRASATK